MLFFKEKQVGIKPTTKALLAKRKKEDGFIKRAIKRHERPWRVVGVSKAAERRKQIDDRLIKRGIKIEE